MRMVTYVILALLLLVGITFACLNADPVLINYYFGKRTMPLSLLVVLTFTLGCLLGLLVGCIMTLKQKSKNYRLQHRIKIAEKELANLRTIPLKDSH